MIRSGVGRADLLRALAANANNGPRQQELAEALEFGKVPETALMRIDGVLPVPQLSVSLSLAEKSPIPIKPPLRAPLFGIVHAQAVAPTSQKAPAPLQTLEPQDYVPRSETRLRPQRLLPGPALARHAQDAVQLLQPGRTLDTPRLVQQLARARVPPRWPYRERADWPAHVTLVIDRSQHLRPYFGDQQQLLNALALRQGVAGLSTYTVHGDPQAPLTHWAGGRAQPTPRQIAPPPPGSVVLLLTDMGCLRASASQRCPKPTPRPLGTRRQAPGPPRPAGAGLPALQRRRVASRLAGEGGIFAFWSKIPVKTGSSHHQSYTVSYK